MVGQAEGKRNDDADEFWAVENLDGDKQKTRPRVSIHQEAGLRREQAIQPLYEWTTRNRRRFRNSRGRGATLSSARLVLAAGGDVKRAELLTQGLMRRFPFHTAVQSYWLPHEQGTIALVNQATSARY